jgi:hypothetical protein
MPAAGKRVWIRAVSTTRIRARTFTHGGGMGSGKMRSDGTVGMRGVWEEAHGPAGNTPVPAQDGQRTCDTGETHLVMKGMSIADISEVRGIVRARLRGGWSGMGRTVNDCTSICSKTWGSCISNWMNWSPGSGDGPGAPGCGCTDLSESVRRKVLGVPVLSGLYHDCQWIV